LELEHDCYGRSLLGNTSWVWIRYTSQTGRQGEKCKGSVDFSNYSYLPDIPELEVLQGAVEGDVGTDSPTHVEVGGQEGGPGRDG
jgi:hypothetical protein